MAKSTRMKPGALFSAVAWGAMAVTIASLVAPTAAEAAGRPDHERGESRDRGNRGEQFRGRSNEHASPNAWRREARPAAAERAQADTRRGWYLRHLENQADRPSNRAQAQSRVLHERRLENARQHERRDRDVPTWRRDGRDTSTWRQDRRDADRRDYRDHRERDWRNDSDRTRSTWRDRNYSRDDRRAYSHGHHWNRHDWRRDHRYDWRRHRESHRSIYRIGRYYSPYRDYSYRRLSIGFWLGPLFYSSRYWIDDPWYYRLPPVYGPYRWVRYYDDALLVNIHTGEVVDVIYDFFW